VRVIVTSRRDLDREAQAGRLLDELLKVVCVARLELPPLRRRRGDVDVLALHFARELGVAEIDDEALAHWREDPWPGNVRELRHAVVRRLTLGDVRTVSRVASSLAGGDLDAFVADALAHDRTFSQTREELLRTFESVFVERALVKHGGSVLRAASAAGLARRYFQVLNARREKPGD
jgi:two-component system, NtrC family, response regulator HydG